MTGVVNIVVGHNNYERLKNQTWIVSVFKDLKQAQDQCAKLNGLFSDLCVAPYHSQEYHEILKELTDIDPHLNEAGSYYSYQSFLVK